MGALCCRRRDGADGCSGAGSGREKAARIYERLEAKRQGIYERARERAKVAPSFVEELGNAGLIAESRPSKGPKEGRLEASATRPTVVSFTLPDDFEHGKPVFVDGPHGRMQVAEPPGATPGSTHRLRLAPPPEFRVGVPRGAGPGSELTFTRPDGLEICVPVPPGLQAGESFDVPPPALMVQVPQGAAPGDAVVFPSDPGAGERREESGWCRAKVPDGVLPGGYFAARLPPPDGASKKPVVGKVVGRPAAESETPEPEWTEVPDPKTGKAYYWNKATGETAWTKPATKQEAERAVLERIQELERQRAGAGRGGQGACAQEAGAARGKKPGSEVRRRGKA